MRNIPFLAQDRTNLKYLLIIIILAVLVGGGILAYQYLWLPRYETKMPEITITDQTAHWQTYRNERWGYEFKYPQNWNIEESTILITTIRDWVKKPNEYDDPFRDIYIIVYSEKNEWPVYEDYSQVGRVEKTGTTTIDGLQADELRIFADKKGYTYREIVIPKGELLYTIEISENIAGEDNHRMAIFDQILSTFKFIK